MSSSPPISELANRARLPATVVLVAAGLALLTAEPWLVPLGAAAAVALWLVSRRPEWELLALLEPLHRARAERLLALRDQVLVELKGSSEEARPLLSATAARVRHLAGRCVPLVRERQALERALQRVDAAAAGRGRARLEALARAEEDPLAQQRYLEAAAAKSAGLLARDELGKSLARLDGELETIEATLEKLLAQLVRLSSARLGSPVDLGDLTLEVDALVHSLEEVFEHSRSKEES